MKQESLTVTSAENLQPSSQKTVLIFMRSCSIQILVLPPDKGHSVGVHCIVWRLCFHTQRSRLKYAW